MLLDPIIARAQQALAATLREAYYAGRGDAAQSLKEKVLALVEELIAPPPLEVPATASQPAPAAETKSEPHPVAAPVAPPESHEGDAAPEAHQHESHQHESHGGGG